MVYTVTVSYVVRRKVIPLILLIILPPPLYFIARREIRSFRTAGDGLALSFEVRPKARAI